jgi:murein L,D-transpeptidase YcbB/YkuD
VWVEKPVELADFVLGGQQDWNEDKIREAMKTPHSAGDDGSADGHTVTLVRPVPVYIVYLTALVRDGILNFRRDPYGKDREAIARLGKLLPTDPRLCAELQKLLEG